jgi:sporulation protein YlmC with PRC-barrel domain
MKHILCAALATVFVTGSVWAQDEKKTEVRTEKREVRDAGGRMLVLKTADLLGKQVKNRDGTHLGYLDDLVINEAGKVIYAALNTRESPVTTGKLFAVPLNSFTMSPDNFLVFDADKKLFTDGEGFNHDRWPTHLDARWSKFQDGSGAALDRDKDKNRPADAASDRNRPADAASDRSHADKHMNKDLVRITSINGMNVKNTQGEDLGKIAGFAIDIPNAKVVYAALSYGGVAGVGSKYFAIPWNAMKCGSPNLRVQDKCFVLNTTKQEFENATGFDRNNWPTEADTARFKEFRDRSQGSTGDTDRR